MVDNINIFFVTSCRSDNDKNNKIRENILVTLHNPPDEYLNNETYGSAWREMNAKWRNFLTSICTQPYTNIEVKPKGGRNYHYDHEIYFLNNGVVIKQLNVEFKHNCSKIDKLPEYFNPPEKKRFIELSYAEFFYNNYVDRICQLSNLLMKPPKDVYMKYVYGSDYYRHPFFSTLLRIEADIQDEKRNIVRESIKTYLENYGHTINLNVLTEEIKRSQTEKLFVLWDLSNFKLDSFNEDDFEIQSFVKIKNDNVIVVRSKSGAIHNLLLRWKNHLGILYPAWQISLER